MLCEYGPRKNCKKRKSVPADLKKVWTLTTINQNCFYNGTLCATTTTTAMHNNNNNNSPQQQCITTTTVTRNNNNKKCGCKE